MGADGEYIWYVAATHVRNNRRESTTKPRANDGTRYRRHYGSQDTHAMTSCHKATPVRDATRVTTAGHAPFHDGAIARPMHAGAMLPDPGGQGSDVK
jgi:hypothetical protein